MTFNEAMCNKNLTMVFDGTTPIGSTKFRDVNGNEVIVGVDAKEVSDMNNVNTNNNVTVNAVAVENANTKEGSIMNRVAGVAKVVKGVAGTVVTKVTEVIKKEDNTMETINTNNVAVNNVIAKEVADMTKAQMRKILEEAGVELSNTQFKKMLKAELKALLEDTLEAKEIKPVEVAPEKVEAEVVDNKKEEQNRRVLVSALVSVWVYQTTHKYNGKWSLFYDSKKYAGKKIASYKSLLKVTGDTLNALFGEERNTYDDIQDAWKKVANAGYCSIDTNGFVSIDNNQWTNCLVLSKAINQQAVRANAQSICGFLKEFTK